VRWLPIGGAGQAAAPGWLPGGSHFAGLRPLVLSISELPTGLLYIIWIYGLSFVLILITSAEIDNHQNL